MKSLLLLPIAACAIGCRPLVTNAAMIELNPVEFKAPGLKIVPTKTKAKDDAKLEIAIFACGCFWGSEARFREESGVTATAVGYIGGRKENPTYKEVCQTDTGHAEAVLVQFDPSQTSYAKLLDIFWNIHNPTTLNRQGPDIGSQYRSAIFTTSAEQEKVARESMKKTQAHFNKPIVTQITPATTFWMAEEYHQQYHDKTGTLACPIDRGNRVGGHAPVAP